MLIVALLLCFEVHNYRDYLSCYTFSMGINHFNLNFKFKLPSTSSSDASLSDQSSLVPATKDVSLLLADQVVVPRGKSAKCGDHVSMPQMVRQMAAMQSGVPTIRLCNRAELSHPRDGCRHTPDIVTTMLAHFMALFKLAAPTHKYIHSSV